MRVVKLVGITIGTELHFIYYICYTSDYCTGMVSCWQDRMDLLKKRDAKPKPVGTLVHTYPEVSRPCDTARHTLAAKQHPFYPFEIIYLYAY